MQLSPVLPGLRCVTHLRWGLGFSGVTWVQPGGAIPETQHRLWPPWQMERSFTVLVNFCADLNRTFPDNVMFRKTADPCLQKTLYNVLLAYGLHNQDVGYCQVSPQSLRTGMF